MQNNSPVRELRYTAKDAQVELNRIESDILQRARNYLEQGDYREIVLMLLELDKEVEQMKVEARRLRLKGKLDINVYNTLLHGYSRIKEMVYELSDQYGFLKQVRGLHSFNRYAIQAIKHQDAKY